MALNATTLKTLMKTKIEALTNFPTTGTNPVVADDRILQALAEAIIEHITTSGQVAVTGVQTGAGAASGTIL